MESRILADFEGAQMVLDFHSESPASARGASTVTLSMTWRYSPRVRTISASPELELAGMDGLTGDTNDFELRHRHFYTVFLSTGNV